MKKVKADDIQGTILGTFGKTSFVLFRANEPNEACFDLKYIMRNNIKIGDAAFLIARDALGFHSLTPKLKEEFQKKYFAILNESKIEKEKEIKTPAPILGFAYENKPELQKRLAYFTTFLETAQKNGKKHSETFIDRMELRIKTIKILIAEIEQEEMNARIEDDEERSFMYNPYWC